jgi:hypothetical protein
MPGKITYQWDDGLTMINNRPFKKGKLFEDNVYMADVTCDLIMLNDLVQAGKPMDDCVTVTRRMAS